MSRVPTGEGTKTGSVSSWADHAWNGMDFKVCDGFQRQRTAGSLDTPGVCTELRKFSRLLFLIE